MLRAVTMSTSQNQVLHEGRHMGWWLTITTTDPTLTVAHLKDWCSPKWLTWSSYSLCRVLPAWSWPLLSWRVFWTRSSDILSCYLQPTSLFPYCKTPVWIPIYLSTPFFLMEKHSSCAKNQVLSPIYHQWDVQARGLLQHLQENWISFFMRLREFFPHLSAVIIKKLSKDNLGIYY